MIHQIIIHTNPHKPDDYDQIDLKLDDKLATGTKLYFKPSDSKIYFFKHREDKDMTAGKWRNALDRPETINQIDTPMAAKKISFEWLDETEDNWEWVKEVLGVDVVYEEHLFPGKGFCDDDDQFAVFKGYYADPDHGFLKLTSGTAPYDDCGAMCMTTPGCVMFNWNSEKRLCEGYKKGKCLKIATKEKFNRKEPLQKEFVTGQSYI